MHTKYGNIIYAFHLALKKRWENKYVVRKHLSMNMYFLKSISKISSIIQYQNILTLMLSPFPLDLKYMDLHNLSLMPLKPCHLFYPPPVWMNLGNLTKDCRYVGTNLCSNKIWKTSF